MIRDEDAVVRRPVYAPQRAHGPPPANANYELSNMLGYTIQPRSPPSRLKKLVANATSSRPKTQKRRHARPVRCLEGEEEAEEHEEEEEDNAQRKRDQEEKERIEGARKWQMRLDRQLDDVTYRPPTSTEPERLKEIKYRQLEAMWYAPGAEANVHPVYWTSRGSTAPILPSKTATVDVPERVA
ncbi:hypothetical protein [Mollivirus kamchatka]|nr:hypothetical protein [Mollivirus kamchatka]